MRTRLYAVALTACIPAVLLAQRGSGAATMPADPPTSSAGAGPQSGAKSLSSRDLADLNPASFLIGKRKKASLADSTVAKLKAVEKTINGRNATFFTTYDSVRKWTMPIAASASSSQGFGLHGGVGDSKIAAPTTSPAEQAKMQSSMRDLRGLMADFRERYKADVADAMAVIPEAQKQAATDLLHQQDGDLAKLGGGRP